MYAIDFARQSHRRFFFLTRSQRATATASNISHILTSSYEVASQKVATLSDTMVSELHNIQKSASQLPAQAQQSLHGLSERVTSVIGDVTAVLREDAPVSEKLGKLREAIEHQVQPLLQSASATLHGAVKNIRGKVESSDGDKVEDKATGNGSAKANGNANGNVNGNANGDVTTNGGAH